jgi:ATP-dependent protease HslVU (ClpYQ) ATPase subunit
MKEANDQLKEKLENQELQPSDVNIEVVDKEEPYIEMVIR